ncbi:MAG TPA: hypothetical protein ENN08_01000 [Bacteroidales bacterium]|nr:hypothetical protein [Bacteroidales bacterium]
MKKTIFTILTSLSVLMLLGQDVRFSESDKVINLGVGFGQNLYLGSAYSTMILPISTSLEIGLIDDVLEVENLNLGVGGYLGFLTTRYETTPKSGLNYSDIIVAGRSALHYPLVDKLDTYLGLILGLRLYSESNYGVDPSWNKTGARVAYNWFVGGRYYFTENLAVMAELGYGISYINIGLAVKF